jgi:hypothetical protein
MTNMSLKVNGVYQDTNANEICEDTKDLGSVLADASCIIRGARQASYGSPELSFNRIADYWNVYLAHTGCTVKNIDAIDVANMMILLKMARETYAHKTDNYVDICGYAALADFLYDKE